MRRTITAEQSKQFDRMAIEKYGIPVLILMENAGRSVADEIFKTKRKKVALFCGKGNNGGDGFVCARHLLANGIKPDIFLAGDLEEVKGDARINLDMLLKLKQNIFFINDGNIGFVKKRVLSYDLIVDAIFGVGLKRPITGFICELIGLINSSNADIISIDIPSGLDPDTGKILGVSVIADKTVTFMAPKLGMNKGYGPDFCGKVILKGLGCPLPNRK